MCHFPYIFLYYYQNMTENNYLYLTKAEFQLKAEENMLLPSNKSSMFRGGFGHIFKHFNCANKLAKTCSSCPLKETCIYNYIFEDKTNIFSIRPYIIETQFNDKRFFARGETITFNLILLGKAVKYLPHFIFAFIELGKIGITSKKYKYSLHKVIDSENNIIFKDGNILSQPKIIGNTDFDKPSPLTNKIILDFSTPLRLTLFGDLVTQLTFDVFIQALIRRIKSFKFDHCLAKETDNYEALLEKTEEVTISNNSLKWKDWTRYSNRQHTSMEFGGLIGSITLEGNLKPFLPLLTIGEYIHVGKNCTFGNGKYQIKEII